MLFLRRMEPSECSSDILEYQLLSFRLALGEGVRAYTLASTFGSYFSARYTSTLGWLTPYTLTPGPSL